MPIVETIIFAIVEKTVETFFDRYKKNPTTRTLPRPTPVAFQTASGHYLVADHNLGGRLVADRIECREWEVFFLQELPDGRFALLASNNQYVRAEDGGGGILVANRGVAQAWESFALEFACEGVAIKTYNGRYLCAEGGGGREVVANRTEPKEWERFKLVRLG